VAPSVEVLGSVALPKPTQEQVRIDRNRGQPGIVGGSGHWEPSQASSRSFYLVSDWLSRPVVIIFIELVILLSFFIPSSPKLHPSSRFIVSFLLMSFRDSPLQHQEVLSHPRRNCRP